MGEFNAEEFDMLCKETGCKYGAIARKMDMPESTFRNKRRGKSEWTRSEMAKAKAVLNMTKAQFDKIFCFNGR